MIKMIFDFIKHQSDHCFALYVSRLVEFVEFTQRLLELANHQKQFHLTLLGLVILVIQISRPLPNKTKTKFDQDFR